VSLAWESFQTKNGAKSLPEMRKRIEKYRTKREKSAVSRFEDYTIGCILLEQPFFLPRALWIPVPSDWRPAIQTGKRYDLTSAVGGPLWQQLEQALRTYRPAALPAVAGAAPQEPGRRYGEPALVLPRLGQGSFRVLVTDAYSRRCAVTGERVLPVLEAAHIKPYAQGGEHRVDNGLLMRSDLHTLFDRGYVTVTPELDFEVSKRIREEWENGRDYYKLHGQKVRPPERGFLRPAPELLAWHNDGVFLG
jgi:putative restriction endonuclease